MQRHIYCDGCQRTTLPKFHGWVGWCFVVTDTAAVPGLRFKGVDPTVIHRSRGLSPGKNSNEAEIEAVRQAVTWAKAQGLDYYHVYSDSVHLRGIQLLQKENPRVKFHAISQAQGQSPRPYLEAHSGAANAYKELSTHANNHTTA